jgi:hypothetical protein
MSYELGAWTMDLDDIRSLQPQIDLVRGLRFIGPNGLSEVGSYRSNRASVPIDVDCLTNPISAKLPEGLPHLSLGVAWSKVERAGTLTPTLPMSLASLNLRCSHKDYPDQRYRLELED